MASNKKRGYRETKLSKSLTLSSYVINGIDLIARKKGQRVSHVVNNILSKHINELSTKERENTPIEDMPTSLLPEEEMFECECSAKLNINLLEKTDWKCPSCIKQYKRDDFND